MTTAYCWYREGTLPVPARKVGRPADPHFAASAGAVSAETVRRYIDTQSELPWRKEKVADAA